ncbi:MAG: MBL fold metallo-hydrolase [candidate division KSB1 bacterium]|jgi:ribonuclease BN (tRNA processing enzyme)|nr:MBL fold metallo-hydrolase [candidate division KSB1 bacterium]
MKPADIRLTILGSGTCIPTTDRGTPGILIQIKDTNLLLDSGSGTLNRLLRAKIKFNDLDYLFYTHRHADHTADLIPILQARRVRSYTQPSPVLPVYGPKGFSLFMHFLAEAYGGWILDKDLVEIHELDSQQLDLPFGTIRTDKMKHSSQSIGYRINVAGKSIVYSGDTGYCPEIVGLAEKSDILILECSFPDDRKMEGHLTPKLAGRIAREAGCKTLVLTHMYPLFKNIDIASICSEKFDGEVIVSHDMMQLTVNVS